MDDICNACALGKHNECAGECYCDCEPSKSAKRFSHTIAEWPFPTNLDELVVSETGDGKHAITAKLFLNKPPEKFLEHINHLQELGVDIVFRLDAVFDAEVAEAIAREEAQSDLGTSG